MKKLLLFVAIVFGFSMPTFANTWNPATCSEANVNSAITSANADGSPPVIINIPAGTCSWTTQKNITNVMTIQGAASLTSIIQDDSPNTGNLINVNVSSNGFRLTGIKFTQGARTSLSEYFISINGTDKTWRFDHNQFGADSTHSLNTNRIFANNSGYNYGLVDHNTIYVYNVMFLGGAPTWGGGTFGNGSWADDSNPGSTAAIYIENNTITAAASAAGPAFGNATITDAEDAPRFVVRFNTCTKMIMYLHGTESSGAHRGARWFESYANTSTSSNGLDYPPFVFLRSGTGMAWENTLDGFVGTVIGINYRANNDYLPWHGADNTAGSVDGVSAYDNNDGIVYATGVHTGANGAALVLTDALGSFGGYAPTFTSLVGVYGAFSGNEYSIRNVTRNWGGTIASTTGTTITAMSDINGGNGCISCTGGTEIWNIGDTYQVRLATACIDCIGRGKGIALTGGASAADHPTPVQWAGNALEPVGAWSNHMTNGDGVTPVTNYDPHVHNGRDMISEGTSPNKVTVGTAATKNSTNCTVNDLFWVTNEGSWNDGSNANYTGQGRGYRCTATNTWTLYYTPAAFPFAGSSGCVTADHLAYVSQPSNAVQGSAMGTVTVGIYDSSNNLCTSNTDTITIANTGGTCTGMMLDGTKTGSASAGLFTTTDLNEIAATGSCTLTATASGLTSVISNAVTISSVTVATGGGMRIRALIH